MDRCERPRRRGQRLESGLGCIEEPGDLLHGLALDAHGQQHAAQLDGDIRALQAAIAAVTGVYQAGLDALAKHIVADVNSLHRTGWSPTEKITG